MTYIAEARGRLDAELPGLDPGLLDLYLLLSLTKGTDTTPGDVHDAWAIWRSRDNPQHRAIIPFGDLHPDTAALDDDYVAGIHRAAIEAASAPDLAR